MALFVLIVTILSVRDANANVLGAEAFHSQNVKLRARAEGLSAQVEALNRCKNEASTDGSSVTHSLACTPTKKVHSVCVLAMIHSVCMLAR